MNDPWISLTDHASALEQGLILYAGNSYESNNTANFLQQHNGANVWARYISTGIFYIYSAYLNLCNEW